MSEITTGEFIAGLIFYTVFVMIISYFVFRWIFSLKRQLWNQKQQLNIFVKIAEKLGVEKDESIQYIESRNNDPRDYFLK